MNAFLNWLQCWAFLTRIPPVEDDWMRAALPVRSDVTFACAFAPQGRRGEDEADGERLRHEDPQQVGFAEAGRGKELRRPPANRGARSDAC